MSGYAIIRSGILDHLLSGKLSLFDLGIYTVVHLQADFKTGIWWGSAPRILASSPAGTSLRAVQLGLQTLTEIGFLRRFHKQGSRGNYPVLIDKYDIKLGALRGRRLNALKSDSWSAPFYELCTEHCSNSPPSSVFSSQEKDKGKNPAAKKASPPDPRHAVIFRSCYEAFKSRYRLTPTWGSKEGKRLSDFLKEHPNLEPGEILRRYRSLLDSTAHFHAEKHGSLFHLLSNFDVFMDGPVFDRVAGGSNGKRGDAFTRTAAALGFAGTGNQN